MAKITAEELIDPVKHIASHAFHGKRATPAWLTAHQFLNRLHGYDKVVYDRLVADHGESGKGSGNYFPGSQVIKQTLLMLQASGEIVVDYLDANDEISVDQPNGPIKPGNVTVAIYRYVG